MVCCAVQNNQTRPTGGTSGSHPYCTATLVGPFLGYTMEVTEKVCTVCGLSKALAEFNARSDTPNRYRSECKKCQYKRQSRRQRHRKRSPLVAHAYNASHYAKRVGNLVPAKTCQKCGKPGKVQMHHSDYALPLYVIWLCQICHSAEHRSLKIA